MPFGVVVDLVPVVEGESDSFSYTKIQEPRSIERVESNCSTG